MPTAQRAFDRSTAAMIAVDARALVSLIVVSLGLVLIGAGAELLRGP